ncbi:MAG: hypothetical protein AAF849_08050 [Bacteroidota bacterium]
MRYLYFGQYATILLIGALALLPSLTASSFLAMLPKAFWFMNLLLAVLLMFKEWRRRMDFIQTEKTFL